ncbi:SDR family oxidoreductase [Streptomyces sp. ISL-98]|uniref:SDR family NAD(P)-dependent oxidoreductase n=1 Tax=Streptomyces sp. ISL-98 TaxID=2819192 RepID=UPI001BE5D02D|nr:SDR family oxidoreductase [Streptomyces sp. ISL-98]MBT2511501.1 SDR family oxidoreductase [Streptomyces sp. ISL-98]
MSNAADPLGLVGARVLVAGATGLVGGAVVRAFAAAGAEVVVHGRDEKAAGALADRVAAEHGVRAHPVTADLAAPEGPQALRAGLDAAGVDRLDVLVNCVTGYDGRPRPAAALTAEEFRALLDTDLVAVFRLVTAALPLLAAAGRSRVVLLSSLAGVRGRPAAAHLCSVKAAVAGLTLALAHDLAGEGVRVNCVAPGPVQEPGTPHSGPLGPGIVPTTPDEVAGCVLALASDLSAPVNGHLQVVNGGRP